ncbi:MAG: type IV pilus assembly protein PilM [Phycisphaerae bacterium]|nr:type IV pilus assembly protein PilM [Phycisphaerae bacterium]
MAATKPVWGIDLGQCALKALRLRAAGDKVEVLDHVYIEHGKILSQPDVDRAALVAETMKKLIESRPDLPKETIVAAVPGQHTLARFIKLPPVDKASKLPELVRFEAGQQIPFAMEEVIWDYQIFPSQAAETEVGIFAMRRELMGDHLRFLSDLNIEPMLVQAAPLALYNALQYDGLCGGGSEAVAILDIGAQNTDLLVVEGDSLWTRNIPIGGNNFTDAMLETFKLSFRKAEDLKRKAGSHKYARQIFQAMRPVFADLVAEVQRSIGFFTSSRRGVKLSKLIAMGNAFKLPGMPKFLQQNLGLDVIRPGAFNRMTIGSSPNTPELIDQLLSFGVAYGLGVQGLGLAKITSNLLPPEIIKQVIWRKKAPWFIGAAACLALSAGMIWGRSYSDQAALGKPVETASPPGSVDEAMRILESPPDADAKTAAAKTVAAATFLGNELSRIEGEISQQIQKVQNVDKLQTNKVVWPRLLSMVVSALPSPDPELSKAMNEGPKAYKEVVTSNPQFERTKRKQVFIQKLDSRYSPDVLAEMEALKKGGGTPAGPGSLGGLGGLGGGSPEATGAGPKPGFLVTLVCRTPYAGGDRVAGLQFISDVFLRNLEKAGQGRQELHFGKPQMIGFQMVKDLGGAGGAAPMPGRYMPPGPRVTEGGAGPGPGGFNTIAVDNTFKDLATGESISNDWQFEVVFAAVIGPQLAAAPAPGGTPPAEPAEPAEPTGDAPPPPA